MQNYHLWFKYLHLSCITLSGLFFMLRVIWRQQQSPRLQQSWVKILPHGIDTLLLCSGILLAINLQQYPLVTAWLTAKFFALLMYIVLGTIALKRGKTANIRLMAAFGAITVFAYIIAVALTRSPSL